MTKHKYTIYWSTNDELGIAYITRYLVFARIKLLLLKKKNKSEPVKFNIIKSWISDNFKIQKKLKQTKISKDFFKSDDEIMQEKRQYVRKVCLSCGKGFWITSDTNNQRFCCISCLNSYFVFEKYNNNNPIVEERYEQLIEENKAINKRIKEEFDKEQFDERD